LGAPILLALSIQPWKIGTKMQTRLEHPQAMLLVVPNVTLPCAISLVIGVLDCNRLSPRRL